jgi:DnaK suppressor protein
MATQRKSGKAAKAAKKPAPKVKAKPAPKAKPAKSAPKPAVKATAKPAPKAVAKPLAKAAAKPAPKPVAKPVAKAPAKPVGKPAVKGAPRVIGKPAVKGAPRVIGKPAVKGTPAPKPLARFTHKIKPVVKPVVPAPNVKPLGVLPPESRAKGHTGPVPHVNRPLTTTKPAPRPTTLQGAQGVTDKDSKEFELRLLAERRKILAEMGHLENNVLKVNPRDSAGDLSGYSFHMADAGTDAMEREKAFLFASAEGRLLMDIDAALRRLYNGEYGTCEVCEKPIARARLEAMPYAKLCVSCKEKEEKAGRAAGPIGQ